MLPEGRHSVTVQQIGAHTWKGICPFHDERTPSFLVDVKAGTYFCVGCGRDGRIEDGVTMPNGRSVTVDA